jgi:paraquat-inducible protein B
LSEQETTSPPAIKPEFRAAQRWNIVWVVPILALLLGAWMIYRSLNSQGPVAHVRFDTAEGIGAGTTDVRCRSVKVGVVREVKLAEDLKSVVVLVELNSDSGGLLRKGTNFWVVRPRVSATDVSGLDTLIKGAYLELEPGKQEGEQVNHFNGLETPPATNRDIPGRRITLTAEEAGSLVAGSPLYYRGFEVGRIESRKLDIARQRVTYDAFIRSEYSSVVKENTRFWNTTGIDISAGADGFKVRTPSFQAMVSGGATFGVPEGLVPGNPVSDGSTFTLFENEDAANRSTFNPTMKFVLLFEQSVRGLVKSAPVEFRGIPIGRVADISFDYLKGEDDSRIPVLVEIDPSLLRRESEEKASKPDDEFLKDAVGRGLRVALKTGSLLTGALFVDLDYYKDPSPAVLTKVGDFSSIPTVSSGFSQLETKLTVILDKFQALPLDESVKKINGLADEATATLASARKTFDSKEFAKLPADLRGSLAAFEKAAGSLDHLVSSVGPNGAVQGDLLRTLDELRSALRSMKTATKAIEEKPNSIIFGKSKSGGPIPTAPKFHR